MRSTSDDLVDGAVLSGMADIFILSFPIVISKEVLINDSVNVGVLRRFDGRLGEARFVSLSVNGERAAELLGLVKGFLDGEGPFDPVDCGFDFFQPRESQDYIFIS